MTRSFIILMLCEIMSSSEYTQTDENPRPEIFHKKSAWILVLQRAQHHNHYVAETKTSCLKPSCLWKIEKWGYHSSLSTNTVNSFSNVFLKCPE